MIPKFRAWLIGQEYMAEIEAIAFRGDGNVDVYTSLSGNDFYTVGEECELIQSTGLCDKNGVEIFEGDVVAYNGIRDFRLYIQRAFDGTYIAVNGKTTELRELPHPKGRGGCQLKSQILPRPLGRGGCQDNP